MWAWLEQDTPKSWGFLLRVIVKGLLLFAFCNLTFAWLYPMEILGRLSLYNTVFPGRERLPYGENPSASYNLTLNNIPAMLNSHTVSATPANDEYRVFVFGDSATWGYLLPHDATITAHINQLNLRVDDRPVVLYNLAYPVNSLTKDLLLMDAALAYQPDLLIWLFSPAAFLPDQQLRSDLVARNPQRVQDLFDAYDLTLDTSEPAFRHPDFWGRTLVIQRRALADLLRLQSYGVAWTASRVDNLPNTDRIVRVDLNDDLSWGAFEQPVILGYDDLRFDILAAAHQHLDEIPLLLVNEPIFISDGLNSDLRYNSLFPRWAYDQYRTLLATLSAENGWYTLDLWDTIDPQHFTDSPLHYSEQGASQLAQALSTAIEAFEQQD